MHKFQLLVSTGVLICLTLPWSGDHIVSAQDPLESDQSVFWGPENDSGIRLGVSIENPKQDYFAGELIRPIFHFRNDTEEAIDFSHPTIVQAVWTKCEVVDQLGEVVDFEVFQTRPWIAGAIGGKLQPGNEGTVYGTLIRLGGEAEHDSSGFCQSMIHAQVGQRLSVKFQLDNFINAVPTAKTGDISLNIVDATEMANEKIKALGNWMVNEPFRSSDYMDFAAILMSMKPEDRLKLMKAWCEDYDSQMIVLCRMLFEAPEGRSIRRPHIGMPVFLDGKIGDWPMEPIAMRNEVPFLIVRGYDIGGEPESSRVYLSFCIARQYQWTNKSFYVSSQSQLTHELNELKGSREWSEASIEFLTAQIRSDSPAKE